MTPVTHSGSAPTRVTLTAGGRPTVACDRVGVRPAVRPDVRPALRPALRPAQPHDVDGIVRLVDHWYAAGENLPRSRVEIAADVASFVVAVDGPHVVGCGALVGYRADLAEIRSLGVDPAWHGAGLGSALVRVLIGCAAEARIADVFVLTRAPRFFERLGFGRVSMESLPEKVFRDCERCPKRTCCDEVPLRRSTTSS